MQDSGELRPRNATIMASIRRFTKRSRKNWFVALLFDFVVIVGTALVLSVVIKAFLIRSFYIPSGSMLETLQINDRIIVNVMAPEVMPLERGDVVVFRDPGGWLGAIPTEEKPYLQEVSDFVLGTFGITAPDSDEHLVKRVIGLPGDVVESREGDDRVWINGVALSEPYLAPGSLPSEMAFKVTVPEGSYWVMGDNRQNSTDSRYHQDLPSGGFVNKDFVVGRAILISWPVANWIFLENFSETFKDVPKP